MRLARCILGRDRYAQGISECLRSTRILQNKRVVCVKFLFRGGERRRRRNSSRVATVPHSLWTTRTRPIRGRMERLGPLASNENSTEFETVRASDRCTPRETNAVVHRAGNRRNEYTYTYMYMRDAHNTELSIIHGSHDR